MDQQKMKILDNFRGLNVLVTGHTGFKGSWLSQVLTLAGANVFGYARKPAYEHSHYECLGLESRITSHLGDINDLDELKKCTMAFKPDVVFHLAAQALVKTSYNDPIETFRTNVMGSLNLLEAVSSTDSVRSLVYITSDKCYENLEWVWGYRETDRLGGHDPYSASKAAAEVLFSSYWNSYLKSRTDFGAATARAGNVIGGGDWAPDRIVPDCIRAIQAKQPISLRMPHATRPWQHVLEPIFGYLALAAKLLSDPGTFNGSWNFGPPSSDVRSVADVATRISEIHEYAMPKLAQVDSAQHEATLLQLNCDKASHYLGWKTVWDFEETINKTGTWYRDYLNGQSVQDITNRQIREYMHEYN